MPATNLLDFIDIYANIIPVDLSSGANAGAWISMRDCGGMLVVVYSAAGGAAEPIVVTLNQATSVSGGSSKVATVIKQFWYKSAATTLTTTGTPWTAVTQAAGSTATFFGTTGNTQKIGVIDVKPETLDVANGFCYIKADIADVGGTAQLGCSLYIPYANRYIESPANKVSYLA